MKRERGFLVALAAGSMLLGFHGTSSAIIGDDGYSYTQPAAELVLPFDVSADDRETFLIVSNIGEVPSGSVPAVTTHWIFWSDSCNELANFNICLTLNDTIVVDPRDMQAVDKDNNRVGPVIDLSGSQGVATVTAYATNEACAEFRQTGEILRDNAIVGSFTLANTTAGFAFGNDAFGLGVQGGRVVLPPPDDRDVERFDIQIFNPNTVDVSQVFLVRLEEQSVGPVVPDAGPPAAPARFATHFIDNFEVPTSLPDTTVGCVEVKSVQPDLIPSSISIDSSGIIRLVPVSGLEDSDYIYGVIGEAIGSFGAASSVKAVYSEGSASEAFLNTVTSLAD